MVCAGETKTTSSSKAKMGEAGTRPLRDLRADRAGDDYGRSAKLTRTGGRSMRSIWKEPT